MDPRLRRIARRQFGLMAHAQAMQVLTANQIQHRLRRGELELVRVGIYRIAGAPETWEQHLLAACLAGGRGAVASFRAAAWIYRFAGFERPDELEITVPRSRRARLPGVKVHDTRVRGRLHTMRFDHLPITTPARTLCDLTACCPPWIVERAVDDALRRRLTTLALLAAVFLQLAHRGRRRSTVMRAILEARLPGFDPGDSDPETKLVRWIVGAGLPRPRQQYRVRTKGKTYKLDLAYPAVKLAIEYDGYDVHTMRTVFDSDPVRDMDLEDEDWRVLHFTRSSSREDVVERVANALRNRTK
jgi:very-short-patch-repair endonuclease